MPLLIAALLYAVATTPSTAQTPPEPSPSPETSGSPADEPGGPGADEEPSPAVEPPGDVLVLENGIRMPGVQVLRATPHFYEVQILEGMRPLQIPRGQVKTVIYDDVDPNLEKLRRELFPEQQDVTIASGERVTSALRDALMAPVSPGPLSYRNRDLIEILEELRDSLGVNLRIHPSLREINSSERLWTVEIPQDTTLLAFLREDLVNAFDYIDVIFESDRIIVLTKDAARKRAAGPASETAPQPPADSPPSQPPAQTPPTLPRRP